jgi:triosephosphate isomerase
MVSKSNGIKANMAIESEEAVAVKKMTIRDVPLAGKRVLLRAEFNVPVKDGKILNDNRIQAELPTIRYILEQGAGLVIMTHLGRPKGEPNPEFSVAPVAEYLGELLGQPVQFIPHGSNRSLQEAAQKVQPGQVALLENVRFWAGEEKNDPDFSRLLASLGDIYVNDAFGTAHRAHCSTVGVGYYLPAIAGFLMEKEIRVLSAVVDAPKHPLVVVMGGAKVSDKIGVIENLAAKADYMLFGGAMANTLLAAQGKDMGASKIEEDKLDVAREMMEKVAQGKCQLIYPLDVVVADAFAEDAQHKVVLADEIPSGWMALDIGAKTVAQWSEIFETAGTIIWNGPLGVYEMPAFATGSNGVAQAMAKSKALTVVGGGDAVAAAKAAGVAEKMRHLSTGGGATLELLEGKKLPGIQILSEQRAGQGSLARKPILAANWKMYKTNKEAKVFATEFKQFLDTNPRAAQAAMDMDVLVCPPFTALEALCEAFKDSSVRVGAQNMHYQAQGAFTGEISARMLRDLGCTYVILGHSERRQTFGETNDLINHKVLAALEQGLIPIICVGETLAQRQGGLTSEICSSQLEAALAGINGEAVADVVLAYEPIWAIGTGVSAKANHAQKTIHFLRQWVAAHYDMSTAAAVRIQYGGSVKPENIREYLDQPDIDGALIGGAGLEVNSFGGIILNALSNEA